MASTTAAAPPKWFVSFDCATKTFAFTVGRVDLAGYNLAKARLQKSVAAARAIVDRANLACKKPVDRASLDGLLRLVDGAAKAVSAAEAETREFLRIEDGETVDLAPGRADKDVSTVERVRAAVRYVNGRVRESMRCHIPAGERYQVIIEFQMGINAPARVVAPALVGQFAEEDVIIVGPALKNKIAVCPEGRRCFFAEKYTNNYGANKAHATFNFLRLEAIFGSGIPPTKPASLRGHMADSFMQVLGHLVHGAKEDAETWF
jgi:hypothetical protein